MSEEIDWSKDATETPTAQDQVDVIGEIASEMLDLQIKIDAKEEELKALKKQFNQINQVVLPEAMIEASLLSITHISGRKLTCEKFYQAKISDENTVAAFAYLEETGNDSLIKTDLSAKFGKGEAEAAEKAAEALESLGIICGLKTWVHHSTLKAFVKEQIESGIEGFPQETFGVYVGNRVKVK